MTNGSDMLPPLCSCPGGGGSDLVPLLVVMALLVGLRLAFGWLRKRGRVPVKNLVIVVLLVAAVGAVFAVKRMQRKNMAVSMEPTVTQPTRLPRLVDLGADKCIPCKMMAPILEDLKTTQAGKLDVEFIDVWKNSGAGEKYGIRVIPTQIFYSADGKELFRHEGFFSKEDILAKWKEFGVELPAGTPQ
jgi:thioredoxin 1